MVRIELVPNLSNCVETIAKKEYWKSVSRCLRIEEQDEELQEKTELLKAFLETTNFKELRRESEKHLIEGRNVKFTLYWKEGKPEYELKVE